MVITLAKEWRSRGYINVLKNIIHKGVGKLNSRSSSCMHTSLAGQTLTLGRGWGQAFETTCALPAWIFKISGTIQ